MQTINCLTSVKNIVATSCVGLVASSINPIVNEVFKDNPNPIKGEIQSLKSPEIDSKLKTISAQSQPNIVNKQRYTHVKNLNKAEAIELQTLLNKNHGCNLLVDGIVGKNTMKCFVDTKIKNQLTEPEFIGETTWDFLAKPVQKAFIRPAEGRVSSNYGYRIHPIKGTRRMHSGIDIANVTGTPVIASASGVVSFSGWMGGYGNILIISHGNGYQTFYAHLHSLNVKAGQNVTQGQLIAKMGSTGNSTGPHLHFEVRINNQHINPSSKVDF